VTGVGIPECTTTDFSRFLDLDAGTWQHLVDLSVSVCKGKMSQQASLQISEKRIIDVR